MSLGTQRLVWWTVAMLLAASLIAPIALQFCPESVGKVFDRAIATLSALATAAAVLVALYLSGSSSREAAIRESYAAQIAAARMAGSLRVFVERLGMTALAHGFRDETLDRTDEAVLRREQTDVLLEATSALGGEALDVPDATLLALAPLPSHCAGRLAYALSALTAQHAELQELDALESWWNGTIARRETYLQEQESLLNRTLDMLRMCMQECEAASNAVAPIPTGEELYGPGE